MYLSLNYASEILNMLNERCELQYTVELLLSLIPVLICTYHGYSIADTNNIRDYNVFLLIQQAILNSLFQTQC